MQIEDYFDFHNREDIRVKGTRVGIEHILYEYIYCNQTAEAIAQQFYTVTLAQVYATILYYAYGVALLNSNKKFCKAAIRRHLLLSTIAAS